MLREYSLSMDPLRRPEPEAIKSPEELATEMDIDPQLFQREFPSDYDAYIQFGHLIPNWEELAPLLGLTDQEVHSIRSNMNLSDGMHVREVLKKWKSKGAFKATYWQLVMACLMIEKQGVAEKICLAIKDYYCGRAPYPGPPANPIDDSPDSFPSFSAWLEHKGLNRKDIQTLTDEGFGTARGFATLLPEDLNDDDLKLTKAGKRILKQLIPQSKDKSSKVSAPQVSSQARSSSGASVGSSVSSVSQPYRASSGASSEVNATNNETDYSKTDCSNAYNTMVRCSVSLNHALSKDPKALALALYSAGFVSQATLDETNELNETKSAKGSRLYSAVLGRVRSFRMKFVDFIDILRRDRVQYGEVLAEIDKKYGSV